MSMAYSYVWVLRSSEGEVELFRDSQMAEKTIHESRRKQQTGINKYEYTVGSKKFFLSYQPVHGSAGIA